MLPTNLILRFSVGVLQLFGVLGEELLRSTVLADMSWHILRSSERRPFGNHPLLVLLRRLLTRLSTPDGFPVVAPWLPLEQPEPTMLVVGWQFRIRFNVGVEARHDAVGRFPKGCSRKTTESER